MRLSIACLASLILLALAAISPAFEGPPPQLPSVTGTVAATLPASTTSTTVFTSSYCAYTTTHSLSHRKNGQIMMINITNTSTSYPQQGQKDVTYTVNLVPLGLQSGDTLEWTFTATAKSGPYKGVPVNHVMTTSIVP